MDHCPSVIRYSKKYPRANYKATRFMTAIAKFNSQYGDIRVIYLVWSEHRMVNILKDKRHLIRGNLQWSR